MANLTIPVINMLATFASTNLLPIERLIHISDTALLKFANLQKIIFLQYFNANSIATIFPAISPHAIISNLLTPKNQQPITMIAKKAFSSITTVAYGFILLVACKTYVVKLFAIYITIQIHVKKITCTLFTSGTKNRASITIQ